jgi:DNA-binding CsgD family transcriptional regulator
VKTGKRKIHEARLAVVKALNWEDLSNTQVALAFRVTASAVCSLRRIAGLTNPNNATDQGRDLEMADLYRSGMTLDAIGVRFGLTRERVRQILAKLGVPAGAARTIRKIESAKTKERQRRAIWDQHCQAVYGCSFGLAHELNDGKVFSSASSAARRYVDQRRNSIRRGINWEITFPEWMSVWRESGKWEERGRGKYVMARIGDSGGYKIGNIQIITASQNSRDSYLVTTAEERTEKRRKVISDISYLSPRMIQVRDLRTLGLSTPQIASKLGITYRAAWNYVDQLQRKSSLAEAA